jgi:hypothetical protein
MRLRHLVLLRAANRSRLNFQHRYPTEKQRIAASKLQNCAYVYDSALQIAVDFQSFLEGRGTI